MLFGTLIDEIMIYMYANGGLIWNIYIYIHEFSQVSYVLTTIETEMTSQHYCTNEVETCGQSTLSCPTGLVVKVTEVSYKGTYWCKVCLDRRMCVCRQDVHHQDSNLTSALADTCDGERACSFGNIYSGGTLLVQYECQDNATEIQQLTSPTLDKMQKTTSNSIGTTSRTVHPVSECSNGDHCQKDVSPALTVVVIPVVVVAVVALLVILAVLLYIRRRKTTRYIRWEPNALQKQGSAKRIRPGNKQSSPEGNIYTTEVTGKISTFDDLTKLPDESKSAEIAYATLNNRDLPPTKRGLSNRRVQVVGKDVNLDVFNTMKCHHVNTNNLFSKSFLVTFKPDVNVKQKHPRRFSTKAERVSSSAGVDNSELANNTEHNRNISTISDKFRSVSNDRMDKVSCSQYKKLNENGSPDDIVHTGGDARTKKVKHNKRVSFVL